MFEKMIVVDCRGHLLGRLAATIAKELLNGQKIVLVRCEEMNVVGSMMANKLRYLSFLRKKSATNPRRASHIHYRTPAMIVWRTVRGMLPHKTPRGAAALGRLAVFEGIPEEFVNHKRVVIPGAIRVVHLKHRSRFVRLGDLASRIGWKRDEVCKRVEAKRAVKAAADYEVRRAEREAFAKAKEAAFKELPADEQKLLREMHLA